MIVSYF